MKNIYLIERTERGKMIPFFFRLTIFMVGITYWVLKHHFKVYDYVVWGSGNLTKALVHYLCQDYEVLWVIPDNPNTSLIRIEGTDVSILNDYSNTFKEEDVYFPGMEDFTDLRQKTNLPLSLIQKAYQKLIASSGERFKGCYYYNFSNKMVRSKIIEKHGIDLVKKEPHNLIIYFDDSSFARTSKLIYADTGNLQEIFDRFWNKTSSLQIKNLIGLQTRILKTKQISFSMKNSITSKIENDLMTFYLPGTLAQGSPHSLRCVFDNSLPQLLVQHSQTYLTLGHTKYVFGNQCFGLGDLCNNFRHWKDQKILCLSTLLLDPSPFFARDFLLLAILAKHL